MFTSVGTLLYFSNPYKLIVDVDDEIGKYYRHLTPLHLDVRMPLYPSHISVIRNESQIDSSLWGKYHNQKIEFDYEHIIYDDEVYYWLNAFSDDLEKIRIELGLLPTSEYTRSPDGKHKFHITIGNRKHLL
jgi:hypothetical protein